MDFLSNLGQGSFGIVHKARSAKSHTELAVKRLTLITLQAQFREALREVAVHRELRHSNIVSFIDFCQDNRNVWLFIEFCDKSDLHQYVLKHGLSEGTMLLIMSGCCDAIDYLHHRTPRVVHRDIKPTNVLIKSDGDTVIAKLSDFGYAKLKSGGSVSVMNTYAGTVAYMAPEISKGGFTEYRRDVDIFSMGIVLLHMIRILSTGLRDIHAEASKLLFEL